MDARRFLDDPAVQDFLSWAAPFVEGHRELNHEWQSPRFGTRHFPTFYDAYLQYHWPFSTIFPDSDDLERGHTFQHTVQTFYRLQRPLRHSLETRDLDAFVRATEATLGWGGVRQNLRTLRRRPEAIMNAVAAGAGQLDPAIASIERLDAVTVMNSGYSKVYSLLLDDFPIYDSRVACALASLVAWYCRECGLAKVPEPLAFGVPPSRGPKRDPSYGSIVFPRLWHGQTRAYAASNLRASWLLKAMSTFGPFGELPEGQRLLAIQSACFMLGYTRLR